MDNTDNEQATGIHELSHRRQSKEMMMRLPGIHFESLPAYQTPAGPYSDRMFSFRTSAVFSRSHSFVHGEKNTPNSISTIS
ncbi:hypothetical protein JTE90_013596 [Oedothorax gibbosus]|uniref:Uncharacterized protein n=1 Tax=Oedothorax gibbosus TaxID=931172 RepID=A0AAV6VHB8_9ARAC|nr:hypothetical protein JTE90_013596 [Oedothorax gibbosus]